MRHFKLSKCKRVHEVYFTPDGKRLLAVGGPDADTQGIGVWLDVATGETVQQLNLSGLSYALSPDASRFALLSLAFQGEAIHVSVRWTPSSGPEFWQPFTPTIRPTNAIWSLAFDPSGDALALVTMPGAARLTRGNPEFELILSRFPSAENISRFTFDAELYVIAFNDMGSRIALTGGVRGDGIVQVYEMTSGNQVYPFEPPARKSRAVRFLPDGRLAVANGRNVYVLATDLPEPLFTLSGHKGQVYAVAVAPDGGRILSASNDGGIYVWDAATGLPVATYDWKIGPATAVKVASDGLTCAAAGSNGRIVVWDVE